MTARHKWNAGTCTRCDRAYDGRSFSAPCPRSESGKPCQWSTCSTCGLQRRREREERDPEVPGSGVPRNQRDVVTEYYAPEADLWAALDHVPPCTPKPSAFVAELTSPTSTSASRMDALARELERTGSPIASGVRALQRAGESSAHQARRSSPRADVPKDAGFEASSVFDEAIAKARTTTIAKPKQSTLFGGVDPDEDE